MKFKVARKRPTHWQGVDSHDFGPDGCPINWNFIDGLIAATGKKGAELYMFIAQQAMETMEHGGSKRRVDWLACHALAAMNYT